jgi:hypothetical protein
MEPTDNGDLPVTINCNLAALRLLHKSVTESYKNWPGGDPNEQVELEMLRDGLFCVLMDTLLLNDLV